jgi:nicotinamide-nucleotide adenylyltransferase
MTAVESGSVHGRFQPFHNGHLEYALAAAERCSFLWVGVTQPTIENLRPGRTQPTHRYSPLDNPLTYDERAAVISGALSGAGLDLATVRIVPFPIEHPTKLKEYIPTSVVAYTTVFDDWNRTKIGLLRREGYRVEVLYERAIKDCSGGEIRRLIRTGDGQWRALVPEGAARVLDELGLVQRMQSAHL